MCGGGLSKTDDGSSLRLWERKQSGVIVSCALLFYKEASPADDSLLFPGVEGILPVVN